MVSLRTNIEFFSEEIQYCFSFVSGTKICIYSNIIVTHSQPMFISDHLVELNFLLNKAQNKHIPNY